MDSQPTEIRIGSTIQQRAGEIFRANIGQTPLGDPKTVDLLLGLAYVPFVPDRIRNALRSPVLKGLLAGDFEHVPEEDLRRLMQDLKRQIEWVLADESGPANG